LLKWLGGDDSAPEGFFEIKRDEEILFYEAENLCCVEKRISRTEPHSLTLLGEIFSFISQPALPHPQTKRFLPQSFEEK
jgi:hypothetical protein